MSFENLPEKARNSVLIQTLDAKLKQPPDADFDYRGQLVSLAQQVTAQVAFINQLFPEYTPHDAQYHLTRLFHIADLVVEKKRFEQLNTAELFVLAAALYAHDWGMAVSEQERATILGLTEGKKPPADVTVLPNEADTLLEFSSSHGKTPKEVIESLCDWRAYVRTTHAERSAARARAFFLQAGGGMGDAVARASRGHGIDISNLEKPNEYPVDFAVHGLSVNLRAITVCVRLVDLLDIGDDRTPYAIWKFVSPQDPRSVEAWAKHRALNPITSGKYQTGRMVVVDGSTSDPDVWAALRDLERYVKVQLRECNDVLARIGDTRFHLDLLIVEWRIATPGFSPIDLRFEFQRERMFKILSDEIYDGDVYVFLRELLQNSIDAIRMRKLLLRRQDVTIDGIIQFQVEHGSDGSATIRCRDNGIGMNENIIRNYLALAGHSYYSSDEFKHLGLEMDPIARFGIGLLSCFMAAEGIEIETRRDPILSGTDNQPLRVVIPAVERQFRVYPAGPATKIGTTITVHVCGQRLKGGPVGWNERIRIGDYLSAVGGFSEFPIVVSENDAHLLLVRPDADAKSAKAMAVKLLNNPEMPIEIRQIAQDFPWSETFAPQDEAKAKGAFDVQWFDVQNDLQLSDYEGRIACLVPRQQGESATSLHIDSGYKATYFNFASSDDVSRCIRWVDSTYGRDRIVNRKPNSMQSSSNVLSYFNGILVVGSDARPDYYDALLPGPVMWINIPRGEGVQLSVSRQRARSGLSDWRALVNFHLHSKVLRDELEQLTNGAPLQRALRIGQLMSWYGIEPETVGSILPNELWFLLGLDEDHSVRVIEAHDNTLEFWPLLPKIVSDAADNDLQKAFHKWSRAEKPAVAQWKGNFAIFADTQTFYSHYITSLMRFTDWVLEQTRPVRRIRFLRGPRAPEDLLPQRLHYARSISGKNEQELRLAAVNRSDELTDEDWCILAKQLRDWSHRGEMGWFLPPFEKCFACGQAALNTQHDLVRIYIRCWAALDVAEKQRTLTAKNRGILSDHLDSLRDRIFTSAYYSKGRFEAIISEFVLAFRNSRLIDLPERIDPPEAEDYVPGSLISEGSELRLLEAWDRSDIAKFSSGPYGQVV